MSKPHVPNPLYVKAFCVIPEQAAVQFCCPAGKFQTVFFSLHQDHAIFSEEDQGAYWLFCCPREGLFGEASGLGQGAGFPVR